MEVKVVGTKLVITLDLEPTRNPSTSGKTLAVATTRGNVKTGVMDPKTNKEITLGVNAYVKAD